MALIGIDDADRADTAWQTRMVFSSVRDVPSPAVEIPAELSLNVRQKMDGLALMRMLPDRCVTAAFFDPQYRGVLDKLAYGNEGKRRGKARCSMQQMTGETICRFVAEISRVLIPSGHLFLWMDKYHLCTGVSEWLAGTGLEAVDLVTWNKGRMGMGYRTRRTCEYLMVLQQPPKRAKGVWMVHNVPDVWKEKAKVEAGVHPKPIGLQAELIGAVSNPGDLVLDPAAGSFSVLAACEIKERNFIGCDLNG
jgi:site-specific DNA-methyltransferase (adenine-specific)